MQTQGIIMKLLLAGGFGAIALVLALLLRPHLESFCGFVRRLSCLERAFLVGFLAVFVAYGGTKPPVDPVADPVTTNTVTYVGIEGAANPNPATFTTNDLPLTLGPLTREGYTFLGWTPQNGVIPEGTVTNVTFVANWEEVVVPPVDPDPPVDPVHPDVENPWTEDGVFSAAVANVYDGYAIDDDCNLVGVVQVKTAKQTVKKGVASITATATVTDANGKKWSYSKGSVTVDGVVTGLKCTTKGCPVPEFGVSLGKNGMEGTWGEETVFGARNGMGVKGDEMQGMLPSYQGKWSVSLSLPCGEDVTDAVRLQLVVGAKGAVKVAGNWEGGTKVSVSAQLVMGAGFAYVPVMAKATKTTPAIAVLLRIDRSGEVSLLSCGELLAGGETVKELGEVGYLPSEVSKGGADFLARVTINELAYPAKFSAKGLPAGLKINAATGVISGKPTKPGFSTATVTVTSGADSKVKRDVKVGFEIANYTDDLVPVEDAYGPYCVGVAVKESVDAAVGCTVSGLPSGMKWTAKAVMKKGSKTDVDVAANTVYGVPTKACTNTVYFKKSVKENVNGKQKSVSHQASATFRVEGMKPWAKGTFNGGGANGMAQLTVSSAGKISGKWMSEGTNWTLSAASFDAYDATRKAYHATLTAKSGKETFAVEVDVTESGIVGFPTGGEDATSALFEAWRNGWKEEPWKSLAQQLKGKTKEVGAVVLTVGANGAVTAKGAFVTGYDAKKKKDVVYSATCSTVLIPVKGSTSWFAVYLYFPPKKGKFDGWSSIEYITL